MTNRKSKTNRKISPASAISILPSSAPRRTCPPPAEYGTSKHSASRARSTTEPKSRNTDPSRRGLPATAEHEIRLTPTSIQSPRTRNGKVARLPYAVRDMVNRMLRNNIPHAQIVDALDELQFNVTERNISNWKTRGGYRDWCIAQDRALETRLLQDNLLAHPRTNDASQLAEVGLQLVATELSQFFLKPETRHQLNAEPEKLARTIGILCRLARQIHLLQKHRDQSAKELGDEHNPELIKRETDQTIEITRDVYSAEKLGKSPKESNISHRNFLPKNGYPNDPPRYEPDKVAIKAREAAHEIVAAIYARNTQSHPQPSSPGNAARAACSDLPAEPKPSAGTTTIPTPPEST